MFEKEWKEIKQGWTCVFLSFVFVFLIIALFVGGFIFGLFTGTLIMPTCSAHFVGEMDLNKDDTLFNSFVLREASMTFPCPNTYVLNNDLTRNVFNLGE